MLLFVNSEGFACIQIRKLNRVLSGGTYFFCTPKNTSVALLKQNSFPDIFCAKIFKYLRSAPDCRKSSYKIFTFQIKKYEEVNKFSVHMLNS